MVDKPLTFQDLVKRSQSAAFVGRTDEQSLFGEHLDKAPADPDRLLIFNIYGQGGMGKTFLAHRLTELARDRRRRVGWVDETVADAVEVMHTIASALPAEEMKSFLERDRSYHRKRYELETDPDAPAGFVDLMARSVGRVSIRLARHAPGIGLAFEAIDDKDVGEQLAKATAFMAKKLSNTDYELMRDPLSSLTPLFIDGLNRTADETALLLVFDTFEETRRTIEPWLQDLLVGRFGSLTANLTMVIAGREQLDPNRWADFAGVTAHYKLEAFGKGEAREFLTRRGITEPDLVKSLLDLSQGMPLLLATLATDVPDEATNLGDAADTAVERFLKWISDPERQDFAIRCSLPRVFNQDVVAEILPEEHKADAAETYSWIRDLPFAIRNRFGHHYHDVVRQQMLALLRTQSPVTWAQVHRALAEYHDRSLKMMEESSRYERNSLSHRWEMWYHRAILTTNPPGILRTICELFAHKDDAAQSLAAVWKDAERDSGVGSSMRLGERLLLGLRESGEGKLDLFKHVLVQQLEDSRIEDTASRVAVRRALVQIAEREEEWAEVVAQSEAILREDPNDQRAFLMRSLGHMGLGESASAVADVTVLIDSEPDWPAALIGQLYSLRAIARDVSDSEGIVNDLDSALLYAVDDTELLIRRGQVLLLLRRFTDAANDARRAHEMEPSRHDPLEILTGALLELKDPEGLTVARQAVENDLACTKCWRRYAQAYSAAYSKEEAFAALNAIEPNSAESHVARADGFHSIGAYDAAYMELARALELNNKLSAAWREKGMLDLTNNNDPQGAVAAVTRAFELDPIDPFTAFTLGLAHFHGGDFEAADAAVSKSSSLLPEFSSAYELRAKVRHRLGRGVDV
jgi:tetratricopeptide (TPR) repeat protein